MLGGYRIVTDDGIAHRPFDVDGNGLVFVCELYDHALRYNDLRRVSWDALTASTLTTCLVCLAAGPGDSDEGCDDMGWHVFNKFMDREL